MIDDDYDPFDPWAPRARGDWWESHTPGVHPHTGSDPSTHGSQIEPLAEYRRPPGPVEPVALRQSHQVIVSFVTSDGIACSDLDLTVRGATFEAKARTDPQGLAITDVPEDGDYEIELPQPMTLPARADAPAGKTPIWTRKISVDTPILSCAADRRADIVVVRPSVTEVLIDGWAQGAKVMRWGGLRTRKDGTVGTARGALAIALWAGRGKLMAAAGHADPLGQDTANEALSAERAKSVQLYACGDLDGWAAHAAANATELDWACAMVACSRILGLGPLDLADDEGIDAVHAALREQAGLPADSPPGQTDWRAIADLYDADLAQLLCTDLAGLAQIRASITWTSTAFVGLGERKPRPLAEYEEQLAGPAALVHRRVGLLVFGPSDAGRAAIDAGGDPIYSDGYTKTTIDPPGEVLVEITVAKPTLDPIAAGRAWIGVGNLGVFHMTAAPDGVIRFPALCGDKISIVAAFDENGYGSMLTAGIKEA